MPTICESYKRIQSKYKDLRFLLSHTKHIKDFAKLQDLMGNMLDMVEDIVKESEKMRDGGVKMEERLREYRKAIESLGFTRKH